MGGSQSRFQTTQWSLLHVLGSLSEEQQRAVLAELLGRYWKPVYCYLRRKGYDNEQAKDLTQGFFHEIVMGRRLIERANPSEGRFRTFLLTALDRYAINAHRHETAARRHCPAETVALDDTADAALVVARDLEPQEAFAYAWALDLLHEVLSHVERHCTAHGKEAHWRLFHEHIVEPILSRQESTSLTELCGRFDIPTTIKAENMIETVRRRFRAIMKERVRQYVASDEDVEQEIRDLMEILSR
jgi:RNA polymerase sigma-70 factor (ECF subfamily)